MSKLQPRQSHAPAHRKATAPLEFLYMDTHGPITPQDLAGNRYFHIIVDSFSSAKWVILTKTKGEISVALPQWVKAVEAHMSRLYGKPCTVGTFRTDNAPEFSTRELLDYMLAKHGVEHTTPHGSAQNGRAERGILELMKMMRHALYHRRLPFPFWGEAIKYAAHVSMLLPHRGNPNGCSPWEMLTGTKPDYRLLKTFGAPCWSHVPTKERKGAMSDGARITPKLLPNAKPGLFMGYSNTHNGYRVWDSESRLILIKHGIICDERPLAPSNELVMKPLPDNPIYNHIGELIRQNITKQFSPVSPVSVYSI